MRDAPFVNYFACAKRDTSFNVAVARVLIGVTCLWKLFSYDFAGVGEWPLVLFETSPHGAFLFGAPHLALLTAEVVLAAAALAAFTVGWHLALSSFASALLLAHLSALHYVPSNAASTWLPFVYAILLFGVYRDTDTLSLDARGAEGPRAPAGDTIILRWLLFMVATLYFFTGFSKLKRSGIGWASADNLGLLLHQEAVMHLGELPPLALFLMDHPVLLGISTVLTLVLECGFLFAVVLRLPITPFVVGLGGMHAMIAFSMDIFFFDQYLIYLIFVPWDRLRELAARRAAVAGAVQPSRL